ncbi:MAG: beta-lactamase family protein [Calditrichaeota bacterium]|nr:beta-lactamase family protein [Calditrichota bacterium]
MIHILLIHVLVSISQSHNTDAIATYLDSLQQAGKINGHILLRKNKKTIYEKSFGYTDGSKQTFLTKGYRFNIGSVYKEFPAVAIMQLQEKKRLSIDDKVSDHLKELPDWSEQITIKQLMQYSSGLPLIPWNDYFSKGITITDADLLNGLQEIKTLEFEPGTDYLYSNNNPILLIKLVETISQSRFSDYLRDNILDPYGLKTLIIKDQYPYQDRTLMAIPFNADFKEDAYSLSVKSLLFTATAADLVNWFEQLSDFRIVSKESMKILSETAKTGDNIESPLGYCSWDNDDIIEHSHHGSTANYECIVRNYKQDGITIVILTNQKQRNVFEISDRIYRLLRAD